MFYKIGFLEIQQISEERLESLFDNTPDLQDCNFIKKRLQHKCFPMKFAKFLRTPFLQNTSSGWLLLKYFIRILSAMRMLHVGNQKHYCDCSLSIFNYSCIWFMKYLFQSMEFYSMQYLSLKSAILENSRHCINIIKMCSIIMR